MNGSAVAPFRYNKSLAESTTVPPNEPHGTLRQYWCERTSAIVHFSSLFAAIRTDSPSSGSGYITLALWQSRQRRDCRTSCCLNHDWGISTAAPSAMAEPRLRRLTDIATTCPASASRSLPAGQQPRLAFPYTRSRPPRRRVLGHCTHTECTANSGGMRYPIYSGHRMTHKRHPKTGPRSLHLTVKGSTLPPPVGC